jgi:hypothetical protein
MIKILKTSILAIALLLNTLEAANPISQAKAGGKGNNPVSQQYLYQGSSNNPVSTYQVGDYAQGGVVCYVDDTGQHGLVCSLIYLDANGGEDTGLAGLTWGIMGVDTGATSPLGAENMLTILGKDPSLTFYPAFRACRSYRGGSFSDWFLPSQNTAHDSSGYNELNFIYSNLNIINNTIAIISGAQALDSVGYHWSSFGFFTESAYNQNFSNGTQTPPIFKINKFLVRAVRAF